MNQHNFTTNKFVRKYAPLPERYWAIRQRAYLKAAAPFVWVKAARIVRDRRAPVEVKPERYGLVFRGKFRNWDWLKRNTVCRLCHKPIGQTVVNPVEGTIDHDGVSCFGPHEHIIAGEGDLMLSGQFEWLRIKQQLEADEVIKIYSPQPKSGLGTVLYPVPVAGLD